MKKHVIMVGLGALITVGFVACRSSEINEPAGAQAPSHYHSIWQQDMDRTRATYPAPTPVTTNEIKSGTSEIAP